MDAKRLGKLGLTTGTYYLFAAGVVRHEWTFG